MRLNDVVFGGVGDEGQLNPCAARARARYGTDSAVRLNDVFFAAHASCITLATLAQCAVYDCGSQRVHARTRTAFAVMVPVTAIYAAAVWLSPETFPVLWCAPPWLQGRF